MKIVTYLLLFIQCIFFCCGQGRMKKDDCADLKIKGNEFLQKYLSQQKDSSNLIMANLFFDQAIQCDSTSGNPYVGKLRISFLRKRYSDSQRILNKLYILSNRTDNSLITMKAVLFEHLSMTDSSNFYYAKADSSLKMQIRIKTKDSIKVICDQLYLVALTKGKEKAIEELNKHLRGNENNDLINTYKTLLRDFDKNVVLNGF